MTDKLKVGVVGVGYLGKFHARIYSDMNDVELVGVVDSNPETAASIAEKYNCAAFTNYIDLVDKVDAVSVVVPTKYHLEVARPFLENRVHMLMEKPLAPTYEEGETMVALARKMEVIFQVGHLERYNAGVRLLTDKIDKPRFIEVHRLGQFVERATDVDVVTDLMIHDIDIVIALVGARIKKIDAVGIPVITEHVDIANARLEFENGVVANVTASRVSNKKFRRIRIFSRSKYFGLNYDDQQLEIVSALPTAEDQERPEIQMETIDIKPEPPLDAELADFIDCVRNNRTPLVDGLTGLEALRVAMLVKEKIAACQK